MAKWAKRLVGVGVLAGVGYALWRVLEERVREQDLTWTPQPFPMPPKPEPAEPGPEGAVASDAPGWVEPVDGACPASHPVKAKLGSGIFHVPGGQMYERTVPDRCYVDPAAAEADDLRASKR